MLPENPVFLGFRVKHVEPAASWHGWRGDPSLAHIAEICSVSDCISDAPPKWEDRWNFNRFCCYNSEEEALGTVPTGEAATIRTGHKVPYELFALKEIP